MDGGWISGKISNFGRISIPLDVRQECDETGEGTGHYPTISV